MTTDIDRIMRTKSKDIALDPNSDDIAAKFWATANMMEGQTPAHIGITTSLAEPTNDYTQVIAEIPDGAPVKSYTRYGWTRDQSGNFHGRQVPLPCPTVDKNGDVVLPPNGKDSQLSVRTPDGTWYNYWRMQVPWNNVPSALYDNRNVPYPDFFRDLLARRWFNSAYDFVTSTVEKVKPDEKGNLSTASPAIPMHHVTRIDELFEGIQQCMSMTVSGMCSMNGPEANIRKGEQRMTSHTDPRINKPVSEGGRGASRMPSLMMESHAVLASHHTQCSDSTRFWLDITDEEIDAWIAPNAASIIQQLKRNLAVGFREYGWMIVATSGPKKGCALLTEGSPSVKKKLQSHGLTQATMNTLLDGLLRPDRIRVVVPPTGIMADGTKTTMHAPVVSVAYDN